VQNREWKSEAKVETNTNSEVRNEEPKVKIGSQFLADSYEQIQESMEGLRPLWDQLCRSLREAIERVKQS
jgi:hypothetical protein